MLTPVNYYNVIYQFNKKKIWTAIFHRGQILFRGFAFFDFIDICNRRELALACATGKVSVI
jgi:hypothetical protein